MFHRRVVRPAIINGNKPEPHKLPAIPYTPAYYEQITDADYPVPVGRNLKGDLVYANH